MTTVNLPEITVEEADPPEWVWELPLDVEVTSIEYDPKTKIITAVCILKPYVSNTEISIGFAEQDPA
jgi:hypothetical protein